LSTALASGYGTPHADGAGRSRPIDGQPVALRVTMRDRQGSGSSVIDVSKLRFGVDLPDTLFQRAGLSQAANSPIWKGLQ
jgi:hypothetical protein